MKNLATVCMSVLLATSVGSDAFGWGAVSGPRGGAAYRGPMGGAAVRTPSGAAAVRGPYGAGAVRGPAGNTAVRGPTYGGTTVRSADRGVEDPHVIAAGASDPEAYRFVVALRAGA